MSLDSKLLYALYVYLLLFGVFSSRLWKMSNYIHFKYRWRFYCNSYLNMFDVVSWIRLLNNQQFICFFECDTSTHNSHKLLRATYCMARATFKYFSPSLGSRRSRYTLPSPSLMFFACHIAHNSLSFNIFSSTWLNLSLCLFPYSLRSLSSVLKYTNRELLIFEYKHKRRTKHKTFKMR